MESFSYSLLPAATTLCTLFALSLSFFYISSLLVRQIKRRNNDNKNSGKDPDHEKKRVPKASGSWPLLGHLHLLRGPVPSHIVLSDLADKNGPMFSVNLGVHRTIVVNTWEMAKECLTTHDQTFATRPKSLASEVLAYNDAMLGLSPYGPYWRQIRKLSAVHLLSHQRLELLRYVRESEIHASVKDVYEMWRNSNSTRILVDMKRWFGEIPLNVMFRMIVGKRFDGKEEGDEKARQAIRDFFELVAKFAISDGLPFLRCLDLGGQEKAMHKTAKELDGVLQGWLDEHKAKRKQNENEEMKGKQDFMDVMLSVFEHKADIHGFDAATVNQATCMAMILGGSDTTVVSLTWALSLLLNNKECLKKVQQELDTTIGRDKQIVESDLNNLPYLKAVIKETLRLYPPAPLAIQHEATKDCTVKGYIVPKGIRLLLNLYKIQRDPRTWLDPNEFKPERFLTAQKDFDVRGQNFEFIPFGGGRRVCPGISLALPVLGLSLASFLQAFEVQTLGDEAIDMTEIVGVTNLKATPLEVLINPRVPESVYYQYQ